jgi:hypothetical protein
VRKFPANAQNLKTIFKSFLSFFKERIIKDILGVSGIQHPQLPFRVFSLEDMTTAVQT